MSSEKKQTDIGNTQESSGQGPTDFPREETGRMYFTKDGEKIPGGPYPVPRGANDLKIIWRGGRIVAAYWTRNGKPFQRIPVPPEANDFHFELVVPTTGRTLDSGTQGDDVTRLQEDLCFLGHESVGITGIFDDATAEAVCSLQETLGLDPSGIVDAATTEVIGKLVEDTMVAEMTPLSAEDIQDFAQTASEWLIADKGPEGPKHKAWRERLKRAFGRRLRQEGFTEDEISKIVEDMFKGVLGIILNLWRLYKALRAWKKAKEDVGEAPAWDE